MYSYQAVTNKTTTRNLQLAAWKRAVDYNRELLKNGYATYTDVLTSEQDLPIRPTQQHQRPTTGTNNYCIVV